jgi:hypothetical protein
MVFARDDAARRRGGSALYVPTRAADAELTWFFTEAESEVDLPSNFGAIAGVSPCSLAAVENRLDAMHAAGKIRAYLDALPVSYRHALVALYTECTWPPRVERALGRYAGVVEASPIVKLQYARALARGRTKTPSPARWLDELIERGGPATVAGYLREAERECSRALRTYDAVRRHGPSVAPSRQRRREGEGDR